MSLFDSFPSFSSILLFLFVSIGTPFLFFRYFTKKSPQSQSQNTNEERRPILQEQRTHPVQTSKVSTQNTSLTSSARTKQEWVGPKFCSHCGTPCSRQGFKFCEQCGANLSDNKPISNQSQTNKSMIRPL